MVIVYRRRCGLSRCVTRYMVAMAAADLLVMIFDLTLMHIPIVFPYNFRFMLLLPVCNIHSALIYAVRDASVWFTVAFTFDRFVAICCQKLRTKYCTEKTAAMVLGTLTAFVCLKDTTWYFMEMKVYRLGKNPGFCGVENGVTYSVVWGTIELLHYIFTPFIPFFLILFLNALTVRNILVVSRARRRLRSQVHSGSSKDIEMESRRKSIVLLFVISGNFIFLWTMFTINVMLRRLFWLGIRVNNTNVVVHELGFMLQLLSCCTNTITYSMTQDNFRKQLKGMAKYPFSRIAGIIKPKNTQK
ncbi:cysteinyl leukotriene receptor 1-like [Narcine bancroftii]|uniref:cysteinyl leukotriene receptor 1-like n=1 Tax=Narcine bancroftii TaxID=1343680 RepID=UPI00383182B3